MRVFAPLLFLIAGCGGLFYQSTVTHTVDLSPLASVGNKAAYPLYADVTRWEGGILPAHASFLDRYGYNARVRSGFAEIQGDGSFLLTLELDYVNDYGAYVLSAFMSGQVVGAGGEANAWITIDGFTLQRGGTVMFSQPMMQGYGATLYPDRLETENGIVFVKRGEG